MRQRTCIVSKLLEITAFGSENLSGCTGKVFVFFILLAIRGGAIRCGWIFVCILEVAVIVLNKVPMRVCGGLWA